VRGKPGQQRRYLAVLPGRGAGQRQPLHDESPDELGQGRENVEYQPACTESELATGTVICDLAG